LRQANWKCPGWQSPRHRRGCAKGRDGRCFLPVWGLGLMGAGFLSMAAVNTAAQPSIVLVLVSCVIAGVGLALTNSPTTNTTTGSVSADRAGMASGIDLSARLITLALNIALMGLVLLLGISHHLAQVLPATTAIDWPAISQNIAAGKLESMGLAFNDAQAALRHGAGWAMLFAGLGAGGLAMLSRYFFRRGR